ncbi:MAG: hypothetical protein ABFD69_04425 [Candidatus Sumerlaeia bacterium]
MKSLQQIKQAPLSFWLGFGCYIFVVLMQFIGDFSSNGVYTANDGSIHQVPLSSMLLTLLFGLVFGLALLIGSRVAYVLILLFVACAMLLSLGLPNITLLDYVFLVFGLLTLVFFSMCWRYFFTPTNKINIENNSAS